MLGTGSWAGKTALTVHLMHLISGEEGVNTTFMAPLPAGSGGAALALIVQAGVCFPSPSDGESEGTAVSRARLKNRGK